jgi:hypothetical protein
MLNDKIDKKTLIRKRRKKVKSIELTSQTCGPDHGSEITL